MSKYFALTLGDALPWLDGTGPDSDIVISTRGRLARNLSAHDFPHHASEAVREEIQQDLLPVLESCSSLVNGSSLDLGKLTGEQQNLLREKHLLGGFPVSEAHHRHLLISPDGFTTALVNAEDHLRLQVYASGFQPMEALDNLQRVEGELDGSLDFAFQDDFGYLSASPVNAGTGLRISVLAHLPGLVMSGEIEKILNALRQLRFAVRGLFGGGTAVRGSLFLISNLVTLGRDESEVADDFDFHLGRVLRHERTARQQLFSSDSVGLEDLARRSLAVVRNALLMTAQESYDRLNHLRLGVGLGMLSEVELSLLNETMIRMQTGHLEDEAGQPLSVTQKTEARATLLRGLFRKT